MKKHPKKNKGQFFALPYDLVKHKNFYSLSGNAVKLYIQLCTQFNGKNNGDFSCSFAVMKNKGWKSSGTLQNSINELIENGLIVKTRQGGRNKCSLYAETIHAIDDCNKKLDAGFANSKAFIGNWHKS